MYRVVIASENDAETQSLLDAVLPSCDMQHVGVHVRHWVCTYDAKRLPLELELLAVSSDCSRCPPLFMIMNRVSAVVLIYDPNDNDAFDRLVRRWTHVLSQRRAEPSFCVLVATHDTDNIPRIESESVARQWGVAAHYSVSIGDEPESVRRLFVELCQRLVALPRLPRIDSESRESVLSTTKRCLIM